MSDHIRVCVNTDKNAPFCFTCQGAGWFPIHGGLYRCPRCAGSGLAADRGAEA